jgi:hypothetical protein
MVMIAIGSNKMCPCELGSYHVIYDGHPPPADSQDPDVRVFGDFLSGFNSSLQ